MLVLIVICYSLLVIVMAVQPRRSQLSEFELQRRLEHKDTEAKHQWRRGETYRDIVALRRIAEVLLSVIVVTGLVAEFGWLTGIVVAVVALLAAAPLAARDVVRHNVNKYYDVLEPKILPRVQLIQGYTKFFRGVTERTVPRDVQSREEYVHLSQQASHVLSPHERKMIEGVMSFDDKVVRDHMTPRSMMDIIGAHELLGPLVLDDLHKTGHSHFPVLDGDIDHIVGILHIHSLFNLDNKKSHMVADVMEPNVYYIREDQTLADALAACIKKRRHLLVVINEFRETVGVITIEDAVEQLIGQKILDQFDRHDDLRAVAARNPRGNNTPAKSSDV